MPGVDQWDKCVAGVNAARPAEVYSLYLRTGTNKTQQNLIHCHTR